MADLPPGTELDGRFVVHGVLGRGGMATVYLAEDRRSGERVALKLLHGHLAADPAARRRLEREVEAAGRLHHPGVLVARELVEVDGHAGLVLPLHTGRTLSEAVAMDGPLPPDQVRRLGLRLAEALGAAHRAGVLHRDLTARNVLVDDRGAPVLTDFGLARLQDQRTARSTALLGTAGFVAPELLAGQRADPRSDLYSLGAVLYQAATGREPFAGAHPQAALQAQLDGTVTPISQVVPDFPEWLDRAIRALLDPDPGQRPQGAAAVVAALEEQRVPEAPPVTGPQARVVAARLPGGQWTVAVHEGQGSDAHKARRALRRRARRQGSRHGSRGELGRIIDQVSEVVEQVTGWDDQPTLEERLTRAVAAQAGLPPEALVPSEALDRPSFRLAAHVDRATAEKLADQVRLAGLTAQVHPEREPDDLGGWLLTHWWAAIPLMWIAFPALMAAGAPDMTVFLLVGLTVALSTLVGPWVARRMLPAAVKQLPIAFTDDLEAHLAPGWQGARAPQPEVVVAADATRGQVLGGQARAALDGLEGVVAAHAGDLPPIVASDLRGSVADLRREVEELCAEAGRIEASLGTAPPPDDGAWAAERLARLETLARAGQPVDAAEQARLAAAVAAHQRALAAEQALDSQLTATLARLLEIAATARRLGRELEVEQAQAREPARALDDLRQRAAAAARARQELAGRG